MEETRSSPARIAFILLILTIIGCFGAETQVDKEIINPEKYIQTGIQNFNEQKYDEAIATLNRVNQQYKNPECLRYLVLASAYKGNTFAALGYMIEYKKITDQNQYYLLKTEKELIAGNLDQAEFDFNRIEKTEIDYRDYLRVKKELFTKLGRHAQAVAISAIEEKYGLE